MSKEIIKINNETYVAKPVSFPLSLSIYGLGSLVGGENAPLLFGNLSCSYDYTLKAPTKLKAMLYSDDGFNKEQAVIRLHSDNVETIEKKDLFFDSLTIDDNFINENVSIYFDGFELMKPVSGMKNLVDFPVVNDAIYVAPIGVGGGNSLTIEDITVIAPSGNIGGYDHGEIVTAPTNHNIMWKKLLQDGAELDFVLPTGSVTSDVPASLFYEIGTVLIMDIGYTYNQNDAGLMTSIQVREDINSILEDNGLGHSLTITSVKKSIDALMQYATGSGTKTNQAGEVFNNDIVAGSIDTSNLEYQGELPFFYGKSAVKPIAGQTLINGGTKAVNGVLIQSANGTLNIDFAANGDFVWFAIPNTSPNKTTYYKTALDTGGLGLIFEAAQVVSNIESPTIVQAAPMWANESYTFYISKVSGTHNTNMQIIN
jgi:hypothetical protein